MEQSAEEFVNEIHDIVYKQFDSLPPNGKPQHHEWTVVAAIVEERQGNKYAVAMATGTKCIGESELSMDGLLVNDSHAEVLCKRSFDSYLLDKLNEALVKKDLTYFVPSQSQKYRLRDDIRYHMYISQSPCGMGSIYYRRDCKRSAKEVSNSKIRLSKRLKEATLSSESLDKNKEDYHLSGAKEVEKMNGLSTKPGRGNASISHSCSDKICLWNWIGIQGGLLSRIIDPVFLSSIVIGGEWDENTMMNALYHRICIELPIQWSMHPSPRLYRDKTCFYSEESVMKRLQENEKMSACGSALLWNATNHKEVVIAAKGIKLGSNIKKGITLKNSCFVSPYWMFVAYCNAMKKISDEEVPGTYEQEKEKAEEYRHLKRQLLEEKRESSFIGWKRKERVYYQFYPQ